MTFEALETLKAIKDVIDEISAGNDGPDNIDSLTANLKKYTHMNGRSALGDIHLLQ